MSETQDLMGLIPEDEMEVEIHDLSYNPTGIKVRLAGPYSELVKAFNQKAQEKQQRFMRRIGNPRRMSSAQEEQYNQLLRDIVNDKLVHSILGWSSPEYPSGVTLNGEVLDATKENVRMVLEKVPFFRDQLMVAMGDESLFTKTASQS